jgi:hypothetical protein
MALPFAARPPPIQTYTFGEIVLAINVACIYTPQDTSRDNYNKDGRQRAARAGNHVIISLASVSETAGTMRMGSFRMSRILARGRSDIVHIR